MGVVNGCGLYEVGVASECNFSMWLSRGGCS